MSGQVWSGIPEVRNIVARQPTISFFHWVATLIGFLLLSREAIASSCTSVVFRITRSVRRRSRCKAVRMGFLGLDGIGSSWNRNPVCM